ncbi:MAG: hypothetical protein V1835_02980, partial [Candidatus Micrarchaeota archaeon]
MRWLRVWTHRPYSARAMVLVLRGVFNEFPKHFPSAITAVATSWENGLEDYLYPEKEFLEITESIGRKAIEDPEFIYSSFRQALEKAVEMRGYSE